MNPDIAWPAGAQPFAHLQQVHDKELLYKELQKGVATEILLPVMNQL